MVRTYSKAYTVKVVCGQQAATIFTSTNFQVSGYTVLGIVGYCTGNNQVYPYHLDTGLVQIATPLDGSASSYSGTMSIQILYVKN